MSDYMTQDTENKICKCGNQMVKISGFRKVDGRPYSGWKCNQCNTYEPIPLQGGSQGGYQGYQPRPRKPEPNWEEIRDEKRTSIEKMNALNNSVVAANAWLEKGSITNQEEYDKTVRYFFNEFLKLLENGNK